MSMNPVRSSIQDQLGMNLGQRAVQVGYLKCKIENYKTKISQNPCHDKFSERLSEIFDLIKEQKQLYKAMNRQVLSLQRVVPSHLGAQIKQIEGEFESSKKKALAIADQVVNAQSQLIETRLKETIGKLNVFRQSLSQEQLSEIEKENQSLLSRIKEVRALGHKYALLTGRDWVMFDLFKDKTKRLREMIDFQKPGKIGHMFASLKKVCDNPDQFDKEFLQKLHEQLDKQIDKMPNEFIKELDEMICQHVYGSNGDNLWNKSHRYDDLVFFRDTIRNLIYQDLERKMLTDVSQEQLDKFYETFFIDAFGPKGEDCKNWVKSEFLSLFNLVNKAFEEFKRPPSSPLQFTEESSSSGSAEDNMLDLSQFKDHSGRYASIKTAQLNCLLRKVCHIEKIAENSETTNQKLIKEAITETLSGNLCCSLYGMISFMAPNSRGDHGWGKLHCADDPARLRNAIFALMKVIAQ